MVVTNEALAFNATGSGIDGAEILLVTVPLPLVTCKVAFDLEG
jgi:hypothetical protein